MKFQLIFCLFLLKAVMRQTCARQEKNVCLPPQLLMETLSDNFVGGSSNSIVTLTGVANLQSDERGEMKIQSNLNVTKLTTIECPSLEHPLTLSTTEFISRLTAPCRYDRMERPPAPIVNGSNAVRVTARAYVFVFDSLGSSNFQFNMQALLQLSYVDPRLAYAAYAPSRTQPLQGKAVVRNKIWVPHLFFTNEQDSSVLGTLDDNILTSISPDGTVTLATHLQATIFCWSQQIKFPFDEQLCTTTLESWRYNSSELLLMWEENLPIAFNSDMQSKEYTIEKYWQNSTLVNAQDAGIGHAGCIGNFSSLSFTVYLVHSAGYYIMDYFIPTMIMVAISWVSFWLRADQTPARTIMCCTTMLSLITLASSHLKASSRFVTIFEIWFLGCVLFIFGALIEFAFSNTIFRRTVPVKLKKVNSKSILKSTVVPRSKKQPHCMNGNGAGLDSTNSSTEPSTTMTSCATSDPFTLNTSSSKVSFALSYDSCSTVDMTEPTPPMPQPQQTFATMTGEEISLWLDRKARFVFPLTFLIFNVFFWTFVMIL